MFSACTLHPAFGVTLRERDEPAAAELDTLVTDAGDEECGPHRALGLEVVRV